MKTTSCPRFRYHLLAVGLVFALPACSDQNPVLDWMTQSQSPVEAHLDAGDPLSAADLARHLNVRTWSLVYHPQKEVNDVRYSLIYRSRPSETEAFEETVLLGTRSRMREPMTSLPITVCIDENKSTLIIPDASLRGAGMETTANLETLHVPFKNERGRYTLGRTHFGPGDVAGWENLKGELELLIEAEYSTQTWQPDN